MLDKLKIENIVKNHIEETDKFLVEVDVSKGNVINVYVDGDNGISIDECVKISRIIESEFDREVEDYELRVSSPGLDRPFKLLRQYKKYIGKEIKVTTNERENVIGVLKSFSENGINVEKKTGKKGKDLVEEKFRFDEISSAKPVVTFKKAK
ncbi:MAG: hypothetical protein B6D61_08815 [Bacteroidetes bacterium 4484_249]|nr:MAG: hypothetical protein B6D61_08815 [Bacteroidetes bacterium 4484_249]